MFATLEVQIVRKLLGSMFVMVALVVTAGPTLTPFAAAQSKPKDAPTQKDKTKPADTKQPAVSLTTEIYKDTAGEFRFRIKDGDTLLASSGKGYDTKDEVMAVVGKLKMGMAAATTLDNSGEAPAKTKAKDKKDK